MTWTFALRDGLTFHDGDKVLAKDNVTSLKRWASRDSFGQQLTRVANEKLDELRDAWFDAPEVASQRAIADQIQLRALETLPQPPAWSNL